MVEIGRKTSRKESGKRKTRTESRERRELKDQQGKGRIIIPAEWYDSLSQRHDQGDDNIT